MKIAALDFDGTLYHRREDGSHSFNQADLDAICEWRDAGHMALIATGRSRSALTFAMPDSPATDTAQSPLAVDYRVLSNGGSAASGDGTELIYAYPIDTSILEAAIDRFSDVEGVAVFGTTIGPVDGMFTNTTRASDEFTAHFSAMTKADIDEHTFAVVPIWVPDDDVLRAEVVEWATQFDNITVAQNQDYVDIMAAGRNKGTGIIELLAHIGLDRDDVELYTFGDSWNDLEMHRLADRSHAFPHSPDEVQSAADEVVVTVAEILPDYA